MQVFDASRLTAVPGGAMSQDHRFRLILCGPWLEALPGGVSTRMCAVPTPTSCRSTFPKERQPSRPLAESRLRTGCRTQIAAASAHGRGGRNHDRQSGLQMRLLFATCCSLPRPQTPRTTPGRASRGNAVKAIRPVRDELAGATVSEWRNTSGGSWPWFDPCGSDWTCYVRSSFFFEPNG